VGPAAGVCRGAAAGFTVPRARRIVVFVGVSAADLNRGGCADDVVPARIFSRAFALGRRAATAAA
jgi:hypothetical protein